MTALYRSRPILLTVALLLLVLVLGASGCSSDEPATDTSGSDDAATDEASEDAATDESSDESADSETTAEEDPPPDPADSPDVAVWIQGTWTVAHTLTAVEPEAMREAADQPSATWTCSVNGDQMTVDAGDHVYEGALTVQGEAWTYQGTSTYVDEDGMTWTSAVIVDGLRENEDLFSADMAGEISSDTGGTLYIATWNQIGTRVR